MGLLSVACFSLAAKMVECKAPALSENVYEDYPLDSKIVQRVEFLVLSTLNWRLSYAIPFAYLSYFATKFTGKYSKLKVVISKANELVLAAVEGEYLEAPLPPFFFNLCGLLMLFYSDD